MDASQFKSWQEKLQSALVSTTKTVNRITSEDLSFQRTIDPAVDEQLDDSTARLLRLSNQLLASATKPGAQNPRPLEDADDIDIQWRGIVDVIDSLLEKADTSLDEYTGLVKRKTAPTPDVGTMTKKPRTDRLQPGLFNARIEKPQASFERQTDNFAKGPWKPLLSQKPHAVVPLEKSLEALVDENQNPQYKHPYEFEIQNLKYPDFVREKRDPIQHTPMESTTATWVDTLEGVQLMLAELKKAKEIAVDLEHHEKRTYHGLLSLMQISTREKDWVVDTLKPWRHKLEMLNEVFADPRIVKVFHGSFMDVVWLQRDLGLYVVGLFDTFHACEALEFPQRSLAYLLKSYVKFDADKKYQLADWRIRPLPDEMFYYARSDTHFLLYVYDLVRNELVERSKAAPSSENKLEWVLQRSKETSLTRFEAGPYDETGQGRGGWFNQLSRMGHTNLNNEQFAVYKAVHQWRDQLAREADESPSYLMPQQTLMDIAKTLPSEPKGVYQLYHNIAPPVRASIGNLLAVIAKAKAGALGGPTLKDFFQAYYSSKADGPKPQSPSQAEAETADVKEVRSGVSQLWGSISMSSIYDADGSTTTAGRVEGQPIPIRREPPKHAGGNPPSVPADIAKPVENEEVSPPTKPGSDSEAEAAASTPQTADSGKEDADEEFTLRAHKKDKKKRRQDRKKEKRQAREAVAAAVSAEGEENDFMALDADGGNEEVFDYGTAPSVLHSKRGKDGGGGFNPYTSKTTAEGPKGERRRHGEKAGKSATFKR